jgi:hypothetical protein
MLFCRTLVILAQICAVNNKNLNVETICLAVSDVRCTKTVEYSIKCLIKVTRFCDEGSRLEVLEKRETERMSYLSHLYT